MDHDSIVRVLSECCKRSAPVLVVCHAPAAACQARFEACSADGVTLTIRPEERPPHFKALTMCTVSFHHDNRLRTFPARIVTFEPVGREGVARLGLAHPSQIAADNARLSSRVPVAAASGLELTVRIGDEPARKARPINVSMSGIMFELLGVGEGGLPIDTEVQLELRLQDQVIAIGGIVRRQPEPNRYGVLFPSALNGLQVHPPERLQRIVRELEKRWLQRAASV